MDTKTRPHIHCLQEIHLRPRNTYRLKVRIWEKVLHVNGNQKKAGVEILISDKIDFKTKTIVRDKVSSVAQFCPTLFDPMTFSTPGFPVHHQLPEPTQTHVHHVGDVIQPSHPLSSPSPPAFNLS